MKDSDEFMTDEEKLDWDKYLENFVSEVYPIFEKHGFSRDLALIVFMMQEVREFTDEDDEQEPWLN